MHICNSKTRMAAHYMATVAITLLVAAQPAFSGQLVEYLPGYEGKLPFKLETGYVSVGEIEMFYYLVESQGNPKTDPLFLWLSGGPGCSSVSGMLYEIGPLEYNLTRYDEDGFVTLNYYANTWTKFASILFLDSPVGTGFTYSNTVDGWASFDTIAAKHAYEFLLKWLEENPKYLSVEAYIAGDSYAGLIVPQITKLVVEGLEAQIQPRVNLKGYLLGSPLTDEFVVDNVSFVVAHRLGLISDDIYETGKESCNENYVDVDPSNTKCVLALEQYNKCIKDLDESSVLDPKCPIARPHEAMNKRSLQDSSKQFVLSQTRIQRFWCLYSQYLPSNKWFNDPQVRKALHVQEDTVPEWIRCNHSISYNEDVSSVTDIHKYLTTKDLYVLVMSGDRDFVVPLMATEEWIKSLNLTVDEKWRPWFVDGQIAGYTEKYYKSEDGYHIVFATVKGAGHVVQLYYRRRSFDMFERWVHGYPL